MAKHVKCVLYNKVVEHKGCLKHLRSKELEYECQVLPKLGGNGGYSAG